MKTPIRSLFVPHGAPSFALAPGAAGAALRRMADALPTPRALIVVSAHWQTPVVAVASALQPATIHDFWGFPEPLYALEYPARGDAQVARAISEALREAGLPVIEDAARGLDHGVWVPLRMMYPQAQVPVIPVSLPRQGGPARAWRLGQALATLAAAGHLVVGSGSLTHNLADFQTLAHGGGDTPAYVREFAEWFAARSEAGDVAALLDYRQRAPAALRAHPSEEHLLPFFVALGAGGASAWAERFYAGVDAGVIAMDAYAFGS